MSMGLKVYLTVLHSSATLVKGGVASVEILGVEVILSDSYAIAESLIMYYLSLT